MIKVAEGKHQRFRLVLWKITRGIHLFEVHVTSKEAAHPAKTGLK
jgi:hypothetical protein